MLTKVYRGYIIQQTSDNQWFINNFPEWTTAGAISPGPFPSYVTAKHQIDKLHEYINRPESPQTNYEQPVDYYEEYDMSNRIEKEDPSVAKVIFFVFVMILFLYATK
jgi:hypothetical protein